MPRPALLCLTASLLVVSPVAAQYPAASAPPHLSVVEGQAELDRGQQRETAVANTTLAPGDRVRTEAGRAEILMGDGSALHLDERTVVDVNDDTVVQLLAGRVNVLADASSAAALRLDTPPASVLLRSTGEVRVAVFDDADRIAVEVAVVHGMVDVENDIGRISVNAGERVLVHEGEPPPYPEAFNSAQLDAFLAWSQNLFDSRRGTTSAQYLPADVRAYGAAFDQYGTWSYAAPYGYVWYPSVATTWRPYYRGHWQHHQRFGWTFTGYDPWSYATHHYGRWGVSSTGSWFWIPTPGWGSAWVQWATAPGYVSWCPLGWNNRPVYGFWGQGGQRARLAEPWWRGWSVVPSNVFRGGRAINRTPFNARRVVGSQGPAFVLQQPTSPATAVPRGAIVPPQYRAAGPSVEPRAGRSRRGESAAAAPLPGQSRRGPELGSVTGQAAAPPSVPVTPGAAAARTYRGGGVPARTDTSPNVVYYRGGRSSYSGTPRGGASAYERAGVAVPRGLPAESTSGAARPDAPASPHGGYRSPYSVPRTGQVPAAPPRYNGRHPAYRPAPDSGQGVGAPSPPMVAPGRSAYPAPYGGSMRAVPRGSAPPPSAAPPSAAPPSRAPAPASSAAPAPSMRSAPPPPPSAPPPAAHPRSAPSGSSEGRAVPRRR